MLAQDKQREFKWVEEQTKQSTLLNKTCFCRLNADFQFILISTINKSTKLLVIQGKLVFNNGSTLIINPGYHSFIDRFLNDKSKSDPLKKKIIFSIDQGAQALIFTTKINNINDVQTADKIIAACSEGLLLKKRIILAVIATVGIPLDTENALMRKMLIEKKKLKNQIQVILHPDRMKEDVEEKMQEENGDEDGGVIYFGGETDYIIEEKMQCEGLESTKKLEGGYFSIQHCSKQIKNKKTGNIIAQSLVVKRLKEKRKNQDFNLQTNNNLKLRKELQTVESIKNKKYLVRYFCDVTQKNLITQVYMDRYTHSLQQYVHYLGDSLELSQKIAIAKEVVEAALSLHQSNVIHRDIKPANFLIDDSNQKNQKTNSYIIKIIDFAQSYTKNVNYKTDYACSHPYSPLQCMQKKGFDDNNEPKEGIGKKQIDYWSVGITIYEIFFRKIPVSFSRAFMADITSSWKSELLIAVNQRQKIGFRLVQDIINIICIKTMKFSQEQRMNLISTKKILDAVEKYIQNLIHALQEGF